MISRNKLADTIRVLSMDAVQKAGSGHPGAVSYTHLTLPTSVTV